MRNTNKEGKVMLNAKDLFLAILGSLILHYLLFDTGFFVKKSLMCSNGMLQFNGEYIITPEEKFTREVSISYAEGGPPLCEFEGEVVEKVEDLSFG